MSTEVTTGLDRLNQFAHDYSYEPRVLQLGRVLSVGDGIASVIGLGQTELDELLDFGNGVFGLALNLDANTMDCVLLGNDIGIEAGSVVERTGGRLKVPVGEALLGRVVNHLGEPLDGKGPIASQDMCFVERIAPGVTERQPVNEPLQTGLKIVDAVVPIGRGQRELILGDRQTGKTAVALDTIISQNASDVFCVYVSIGHERSEVARVISELRDNGALAHTIVVVADSESPPANQYIAPNVGCTMAEWFTYRGQHSLVVYDDLTRHAYAYRQLSLLLRRPPGREAFPGDIFYVQARLLERACKLIDEKGGGSLTALPIAETTQGNISAYIPTNLISITDGQIYMSTDLFNKGFRPAVDLGLSVSRVGGEAQSAPLRSVSKEIRLGLSQYEEVQRFVRYGAELDESTQKQLVLGQRIRQVLNQTQYNPLAVQHEVVIVYAATTGLLNDIPVNDLSDFELGLAAYLKVDRHELWDALAKLWNAETEEELTSAVKTFKSSHGYGDTSAPGSSP